MMGYGLGMGLGAWLMMLGWVVIIVAVIALVAWLVSRGGSVTQSPATGTQTGQDAMELLRMRFARGEITKDEYLAAKQTLEQGR